MGGEESFNQLHFFFAVFFAFFFAALGTVLTSESLIGFNLYLKFAKNSFSWLYAVKANTVGL